MAKDTNLQCHKCGNPIHADEAAITKKLINRAATTYYCTSCLASAFEVEPEDIQEKIQYFKNMGCTLFTADSPS